MPITSIVSDLQLTSRHSGRPSAEPAALGWRSLVGGPNRESRGI
jgi:hypothetical protein